MKDGRVIDPAQNIDGVMDILIRDGRIAALGKNLPGRPDLEIIDAMGRGRLARLG